MFGLICFLAGLVEGAAGIAVLTVVKIGFLVSARAGSGIVIAQLRGGGRLETSLLHSCLLYIIHSLNVYLVT